MSELGSKIYQAPIARVQTSGRDRKKNLLLFKKKCSILPGDVFTNGLTMFSSCSPPERYTVGQEARSRFADPC